MPTYRPTAISGKPWTFPEASHRLSITIHKNKMSLSIFNATIFRRGQGVSWPLLDESTDDLLILIQSVSGSDFGIAG